MRKSFAPPIRVRHGRVFGNGQVIQTKTGIMGSRYELLDSLLRLNPRAIQLTDFAPQTPKAPWISTGFLNVDSKRLGWMIEALEIDPLDSDHWLYGTGLTLFGGRDLTKWDTTH